MYTICQLKNSSRLIPLSRRMADNVPFGKLFFGYQTIIKDKLRYYIAKKEKALLDFIYIRKIKSLEDFRIDTKLLDKKNLKKYIKSYPDWVNKIIYE